MKKYFLLLTVALFSTVTFTSCSDDDDGSTNLTDKTMVAGTTQDIGNETWVSSNKYIASVSNGTLTANRVGTAAISSSKGSFNVTVTPKYNLYEEPLTDWDATPNDVSAYMEGENYSIYGENNQGITYYGKDDESYIGYVFTNGKLETSFVLLTYNSVDQLGDFLEERYVFLSTSGQTLMYLSVDSKNIVTLGVTTFAGDVYYIVQYTENTTGSGLDDIFYD